MSFFVVADTALPRNWNDAWYAHVEIGEGGRGLVDLHSRSGLLFAYTSFMTGTVGPSCFLFATYAINAILQYHI